MVAVASDALLRAYRFPQSSTKTLLRESGEQLLVWHAGLLGLGDHLIRLRVSSFGVRRSPPTSSLASCQGIRTYPKR
jgi:hypothetical protein